MTEAVLIAAFSLPAFWIAGEFGPWWISAIAASATCAAFVFAGVVTEIRASVASKSPDPRQDSAPAAAITAAINATLIGSVFLWGAAALVVGYGFTGLYWQHWWQYAAGMILFAAVALGYAAVLPTSGKAFAGPTWLSRMTRLTLAQGIAASIGLVFLVTSGKLVGDKPDWLANHIFLFGGIAVAVLSATAVRAQWRHFADGTSDDAVVGETDA